MGWESEAASDVAFIRDVDEDSVPAETPRPGDSWGYPGNQKLRSPSSMSALEEALRAPPAVQKLLHLRRQQERQVQSTPTPTSATTGLSQAPPGATVKPPSEEWTERLHSFSQEVKTLKEVYDGNRTKAPKLSLLEVRTFFDLQAYNLDGIADKQRNTPGPTLLMYMFYSRIYEKLIGKQRGVDVPLFAPIDLKARNLGFRAILDWAVDFHLFPTRVGRRELERFFVTVHPGPEPPIERFASKITYEEFLLLIALCNCGHEPMERSRVDGSRRHTDETRLDRTKKIALHLCLSNAKKVKFDLHNAYRDVHFWKLSNGADFEKEAKAADLRSRPQWRVEPLPEGTVKEAAVSVRYLEQFTWLPTGQTWEEFEAPFLDMGTAVLGKDPRRFRITVCNKALSMTKLSLQLQGDGPLRLPWRDSTLGPGQTAEIFMEVVPFECGEWTGKLVVSASWAGACAPEPQEAAVPTYMRVIPPHTGSAEAASTLPWHAPRPFTSGSAKRICLDPASNSCTQLRTPTPLKRPCSALSAGSCSTRLPRPASSTRPLSSRSPSTRPASVNRAASVGMAQGHRGWRPPPLPLPSNAPAGALQAGGHPRPCSAPLSQDPQTLSDVRVAQLCVPSRPRSATLRPRSAVSGRGGAFTPSS